MTYLDTSALLKLLVSQEESEALATTLRGLPDRATSCELTIAELTRATTRAGADSASAALLLQQHSPPSHSLLHILSHASALTQKAHRRKEASRRTYRCSELRCSR